MADLPIGAIRSGFIYGAVAVFAVAFIIMLVVGVDVAPALVASVLVGLVVGGGLGAMYGGRIATGRAEQRGS